MPGDEEEVEYSHPVVLIMHKNKVVKKLLQWGEVDSSTQKQWTGIVEELTKNLDFRLSPATHGC